MATSDGGTAVSERMKDSRWIALTVLCVGMLMIVLDVTVVNVRTGASTTFAYSSMKAMTSLIVMKPCRSGPL